MNHPAIEDIYPLSPLQKGLLFHSLYAPDSGVYIEQLALDIQGELDWDLLEQAWQATVDRHPILRTALVWDKLEQPLQVVGRQVRLRLAQEDWQALDPQKRSLALTQWLEGDRRRGFVLSKAPLMRLTRLHLGKNEDYLVWTHHHLLLDGWSASRLLQEVWQQYQGLCQGTSPQLAPVRPYRDYIDWLQRQDSQAAQEFWQDYLQGITAPTPLRLPRSSPPTGPSHGQETRSLSAARTEQYRQFARQQGLTLNTCLQGLWALLLARYSGVSEVLFGTTVSGRSPQLPGSESILGLLINTLPVRCQVPPEQPLIPWLQALQRQQAAARQYDYTPLTQIRDWSDLDANTPLFDSLLVVENYPVALRSEEAGMSIRPLQAIEQTNYPLMIVAEPGDRLILKFIYDRSQFTDEAIARLATHVETLLSQMVERDNPCLGELDMLSQPEQEQLLQEWNQTQRSFPESTLVGLVEEQVQRTPSAVAVLFEDQSLTYRQLNQHADQLGQQLQQLGIGPEMRVALALRRSPQLLIAVLAILKTGAAYIPLDPNYPQERLALILQDSEPALVLTQSQVRSQLPDLPESPVVEIESLELTPGCHQDWSGPVSPESLAYLIYTSGSTGQPKGVAIEHRSVVNFLHSLQAHLQLTEGDRLLAITTLSFDIAVLELFLPLTVGAQVQILPACLSRDGSQLAQVLNQSQATVMQATPATWQMLLDAGWSGKEGLTLLSGGEALSRDLAAQLLPKGKALWNLYGPTETTIWSTVQRVDQVDETIPIGRPIHNTQVYVLDHNQQPVPIGVPGELYLGGAGLAREYWRRPELTRERFVTLPWGRLYRTGDLVRYREDGCLEHLGRLDHQVKLRGYRIELGEIESQLRSHPQVNQAIVVAREDEPGQRRLVAYVLGDLSQDHGSQLRDYLQARLPDYMVPSLFVRLDHLPLTPNGKVDRRALPKPSRDLLASAAVAPQTDLERQIAAIWQEVLHLDELGRDENFFELGGQSLLATQAISRLRQCLHHDLPLRLLFDAPTVARFAAAIGSDSPEPASVQGAESYPSPQPSDRQQPLPLSFAQERLWVLDRLNPGDCSYLIATAIEIEGQVQVEALQRSLDTLIARHESLRTTFVMVDGVPRQTIAPQLTVPIVTEELRHLSPEIQARRVQQRQDELVRDPFDLATGPLLRFRLLLLEEERSQLLVCLHHIITDAWSLGILIREMSHCYEAAVRQDSVNLPPLPIQYADFAVWQRQWLQGSASPGISRLESHLDYWRQQLQPPLPMLSLAQTRAAETDAAANRGALESFQLPASLLRSLQHWSQQRGLSLFMTLLTGFYLLLYRESRQQDIVIGTDIANRNVQETEALIGFFVNILPLRLQGSERSTIEDLAQQVREITLGAYAHQDLPFAKLVEALNPTRSLDSTPLFQVLFVLQNTPLTPLTCPGLKLTPRELDNGTAKFDLALFLTETETGLQGLWNYRCDRLTQQQIQRFSRELLELLETLIQQPQQQLKNLLPSEAKMMNKTKTGKFKKIKAVQPKPVNTLSQSLIKTGRLTPDCPTPLLIQPQQDGVDLTDWAQNNRSWLETQLQDTGAILFRDFSVHSASAFEQVAQAICPQLFAEYGDLPREDVGGNVYGSTPYPAEQAIRFHNESSHLSRWPQKIWFCCLQPAATGGETPIVDCRDAYYHLNPELRQTLETKKLMYVRNFTDGLDVSWQDFFQTSDRQVVEAQCQQQHIHVEWTERGLRTRQIRPAIAQHPKSKDWLLFNQIQLHHIAYLEASVRQSLLSLFGENYLPRNVYYGDGSPLDDTVLTALDAAYTAAKIEFSWQQGDILMLDNMRMAHGRNPFSGSRKIVVTMGEMMTDLDSSFYHSHTTESLKL